MLMADGRHEDAFELLTDLLTSSSRKGEDFGTAYLMQHALGLCLMALGRLDEAEQALEKARQLGEQELPADDPMWAMHWHALTRTAIMRGEFDEA